MSVSNTTNNKSKFKIIKTGSSTNDRDKTKARAFDFSDGKVTINFSHFVVVVMFFMGIAWFIAAEWIYDTRIQTLKNDQESKINSSLSGLIDKNNEKYYTSEKINDFLLKKVEKTDLQIITDCLKGKKYWEYEQCFK